jgi:hypothetical protein
MTSSSQINVLTTINDLSSSIWNQEIGNIYALINGGVSINIANKSITQTKLADDANPAVYFGELFADGAVLGASDFTYVSATGLDVTISGGTAYVMDTVSTPNILQRVSISGNGTYTVLDNTTNYLDLDVDGNIYVTQSATPTNTRMRLLEVVASGGSISSNTDRADREFPELGVKNYHNNIIVDISSNTQAIARSGAFVRDSTNATNLTTTSDITVDITASGANGLDQGVEANSTWYAFLLIWSANGSQTPAGLLVAESNYPSTQVLPTNYDRYRRINWVRNDASGNFLQGKQFGHEFQYFTENSIAAAFNATTFTDQATNSFSCPDAPFANLNFVNVQGSGGGGADIQVFYHEAGIGGSTGGVEAARSKSTPPGHAHVTTMSGIAPKVPLLNATRQFSVRVTNQSCDIHLIGYVDKLED